LQSKNTFSRDLYSMLPLELRSVFKGYILKMLKLLYGTRRLGHTGTPVIQEIGSRKQALLHTCWIHVL
jgi:hypothetical protein